MEKPCPFDDEVEYAFYKGALKDEVLAVLSTGLIVQSSINRHVFYWGRWQFVFCHLTSGLLEVIKYDDNWNYEIVDLTIHD